MDHWALHAYPYTAEIEVQGRRERIVPGTVGLTPPGVEVVYHYQEPVQHRYAHFKLEKSAKRMSVPLLLSDPEAYARTWAGLATVARTWREQPLRADIALWDVLWCLADVHAGSGAARAASPAHPALEAALTVIEAEMARPPAVGDLARRVGVSSTHLIRLFQARFGVPVATYMRERRVEQARHLLRHSNLSPKAVAATIGVSNMQVFNKLMRRLCGSGPRALRGR